MSMDIRSRLNRLESVTPRKRTARTLVLLSTEPMPGEVCADDCVIIVQDEEARQLVLRVIAGEGT